jgi:hypothetical protein
MTPHDFLSQLLYFQTDNRSITQALRTIFTWTDLKFKEGKSEEIDTLLSLVNPDDLEEDILIGLLSSTYVARALLPSRKPLADRIKSSLAPKIGEKEAHQLLEELTGS